jgi:hypothetical protein
MQNEHPIYVQFVKRHYGALIHMLWFVATETSDKGADIAARALALLAPLPNAVSVFNVSQHSLGYSRFQAFAFAFAMELALFAIIEVALHMWDGFLHTRKRYAIPLGLAIAASFGVLAIVVTVVYNLEVKTGGHWVLALLPFISLFAFASLGLKRWHERGAESVQKHTKRTVQTSVRTVQPAIVQNSADAQSVNAVTPKEQARQLKSEGFTNVQIGEMLGVHRNTVSDWVKQTNGHSKVST